MLNRSGSEIRQGWPDPRKVALRLILEVTRQWPQAPLESLGSILATTVAMVDQSRRRALAGSGQIEGRSRQLNKEIFATVVSNDPARTRRQE